MRKRRRVKWKKMDALEWQLKGVGDVDMNVISQVEH